MAGATVRPRLSSAWSQNALTLLRLRYLRRDLDRRIVERPDELVQRVARAVAEADGLYSSQPSVARATRLFAGVISRLDFLPNSPVLMNAGTPLGQLFACFVLPVEDSLDGIFDALRAMACIQQAGGGTGFSFSRLRPRGDLVASTRRPSSGAVSFIGVFDRATEVITSGGIRRGANMGVLRVDHPDILEFIRAKEDPTALRTFNLSVGVTDAFMSAALHGDSYSLVNPRTGATAGQLSAPAVLDQIVQLAWRNGQPGLLFLDRMDRDNPTPHLGKYEATNPCSEQPLLPYEACCLGSINLAHMVRTGHGGTEIDYRRLRQTVRLGVHFLDNAIDVNRYLQPETEGICQANRKIGLGVMGFADLLITLGIPYASEEAVRLAERLMSFIQREAIAQSELLAAHRGAFPNFARSVLASQGHPPRRNAALMTVAPTGTLSILAGCSAGIEPLYALAYEREIPEGEVLTFTHPTVIALAQHLGLPLEQAIAQLAAPSDRSLPGTAASLETAHTIAPEWHVRIQAAFQAHVDAGVSKTVNLPAGTTEEDVRQIFLTAFHLGCKGITVFRDTSRPDQPLHMAGLCLACDAPGALP